MSRQEAGVASYERMVSDGSHVELPSYVSRRTRDDGHDCHVVPATMNHHFRLSHRKRRHTKLAK